ncbi:hypothetical protein CROQUDRAFT_651649 [Cronartium quercuum f. sp. fusiforme G11]|uniref:Protein phosphatase n=1 Tax=Cronartium quercuum f. sp. fusiforme G11 TaxID=708437 RepID=A0A9P6NVU0_9BASI|nr:hypothetical protein CROQUDRAFT_651649 [Cronartium quercuum f. sp. fusiforme G11]
MGVPSSRASLLSLVSLKSHPSSTIDTTRNLLFRSKPSFLQTSTRNLLTGSPIATLPTPIVSFFDPSINDFPLPARDAPPLSPPPTRSSQTIPRPISRAHEPPPLQSTTYYSSNINQISSRSGTLSQLTNLNLYGKKNDQQVKNKKNHYSLINGASGIPKNPNLIKNHENKLLNVELGLSVQVGEDAYFLRDDSLGVADGVGGWSGRAGANSAWFSNRLMHHCSSELAKYSDPEDIKFINYNKLDPVDILQTAYEKSIDESKLEGIVGSTTALIAVLREDELRIANLGDCCCSIIRGNDYIFRTEEQQHSFNYPVQIGTNSKSIPIKDAQRYNIKVQRDDIVILSSDGLSDNLFDEDILEEVLRKKPCKPDNLSKELANRAKTVSLDQLAVASPFSQRANEEGIHYVGGKNDDISVLVAVVRDL